MAPDRKSTEIPRSVEVIVTPPSETSPLLPKEPASPPRKWGKSVVWKVMFTSFLVSVSFGITQVPLIYVFTLMTCDEYYKTHPDPGDVYGRCKVPAIEAGAAQGVAILGASTTLFGVINLFFTGWCIKRVGIKSALIMSVFWPAIRLAVQNVGVATGYGLGMLILQLSQIITVIGGPAGYILALSSFAAEIVAPAERTGTLGKLQGFAMFGTALGFLTGGILADKVSIITPFRVTLGMFLTSTLYIWLFLPMVPLHISPDKEKKLGSVAAFFEPLRMFVPQRWVQKDGKVTKEYGVLLLGIGAFLAVLATGYIPTLLQMYSTDIFDFGTFENGWLICLNSFIRGVFLTFLFPSIISFGRKWTDSRKATNERLSSKDTGIPDIPTDPRAFEPNSMEGAEEPIEPPKPPKNEEQSFHFDLIFTRYSILLDGILTGAATFTSQGWQMYLVAVVLPLASGTGSAAKGTILQMCSPSQRTDALNAISLVEMVARLSTTGVLGFVFSSFAAIGKPSLTFAVNGGIAFLSFLVLCFARFPPPGGSRVEEEGVEVGE